MVFNPLTIAGTTTISTVVSGIIRAGGSRLQDWWKNRQDKTAFDKLAQDYIQSYNQRHGQLKVFCVGMDTPISLESAYTDVMLLDSSESKRYESPEGLQELYREAGKRGLGYSQAKRSAGIEVVNSHQYLMVLGGPGVGKSTFLKRIGLEALKGEQSQFTHAYLPVYLELKRFRPEDITLEAFIAQELETCGLPESQEFTKTALHNGNLLVLLDGLDEVPVDDLDGAINQIQDLLSHYKENRFIASCRTAAYKGGIVQFTDVSMAALDDEQIEKFIKNWFRSQLDQEMDTAQQCWKLLNSPGYSAAKELAQTALLLTLLCVVYHQRLRFPKNRASLYEEALDVLLDKWNAEKRVQRDPIYQNFHAELEKILLSEIAYTSLVNDELFFQKSEVVHQIKQYFFETLDAPKYLNGEAVLEAIELQQGLLVARARNTYSFSHLTLQEYLSAKYIIDQQITDALVAQYLTDNRWREVFLLVSGLMGSGVHNLLLQIEKQAHTYIFPYPKLNNLLKWAEDVTADSEGDCKPATKRAIAIYFILASTSARTSNRDSTLVFARDLARDLARDHDHARARDHARDLARDLARARSRARSLDLARDLIRAGDLARDLSSAVASALELENKSIFASKYLAALIRALSKLTINVPGNQQPLEVRRAFAERIENTYCDSFQLSPELLTLSTGEVESLRNYLQANELLIKCKESAVRVSRTTWEEIEGRMLLFHGNASGF